MTAIQLNAALFHELNYIVTDETLMKKAIKALRRITAKAKQADETLLSKEEFYANIEKAEQEYARGEYTTQLPGESVSDMLKRCGYALWGQIYARSQYRVG